MKISYNWLKEYIDHSLSPDEVADILTNTGLEVEEIEFYTNFRNLSDLLVVGLITEITRHPDADKLTVCQVNVGAEKELNIVCGAPNVAVGQKIVLAPVGAELHTFNGEKIVLKPAKIRGVVSEGMICAEDEIGTGNDHSGIVVLGKDAVVGTRYKELLGLYEDYILEVAITPNRGDAVSHLGVARDLAAVLGSELKVPALKGFKNQAHSRQIKIEIINPDICPRYSGLVISGIKVGESPVWLQNKLKSIGLNPVNNVVDVTNFILFETGQPLHAFDLTCIEGGKIIVKTLEVSNVFKTLDGSEIKLNGSEIMICDPLKPVAMGGVMGGFNSMITESTTEIFIESACFNPGLIRKASKYHGIQSDASYRFERGSDPDITIYAMSRAAEMILEMAGGQVISDIIDEYPGKSENLIITLNFNYLNSVAGNEINPDEAISILKLLGYGILEKKTAHINVSIPKYRADVSRPIDLVEEILRIYSFDKIKISEQFTSNLPVEKGHKRIKLVNKITEYLAGSGFYEILTPSFINTEYNHLNTVLKEETSIKVLNAKNSNFDTLKTGILLSGLETIGFNVKRNHYNLKFFEFGKKYYKKENEYKESALLGLWITGNRAETSWHDKESKNDFYILKSYVENIFKISGIRQEIKTISTEKPFYTYHSDLIFQDKKIAGIGLVNSEILLNFDIKNEVYFAEIDVDFLIREKMKEVISYKQPPKFPFMLRDISLIIDENVTFAEIKETIHDVRNRNLKEIGIVDVYQGEHVESGRKSYLIRLKFQDAEQTLRDEQVDKVMNQIIKLLENRLKATIRK